MEKSSEMTIRDMSIGQTCVITRVGGEGALRQHFLDMGVINGAKVTVVKYAPMGDPVELLIRGYQLTLRLDDAQHISVMPADEIQPDDAGSEIISSIDHPGLGEGGRFHDSENEKPLCMSLFILSFNISSEITSTDSVISKLNIS